VSDAPPLAVQLEASRAYLWALAYRLTGCAADADEITQETLARALERPPSGKLRHWLTRVAVNLGRDELRRRRRGYVGEWLPSPVPADEPPSLEPIELHPGAEARYSLLESASVAFLVALEALTPAQRAVLLLRDVFEMSVSEVSRSLGLSEGNVKVIHHRARALMARYDGERQPIDAGLRERTRAVMESFLTALATGDAAAAARLLAPSARAQSDGGGEFVAALLPINGRERVLRFLLGISRKTPVAGYEVRELNGLPALVAEVEQRPARWAPRFVMWTELDGKGRIAWVRLVLATRKLTHVAPLVSASEGRLVGR